MSNNSYGCANTSVTGDTRYCSFNECDSPVAGQIEYKRQLGANWRTFRRRWESFEISSLMTRRSHKDGVATFQQCLPAEAVEVLDTLLFPEGKERNEMAVVLRIMEAY